MRRLVVPALLGLLAATTPTAAELVVLADGRYFHAAGYAVEGDRARIELVSGGSVVLPLARIDRVVDDELVETPAEAPEPVAVADPGLLFEPSAAVPDTPYGELIFAAARDAGVSPRLVAAMVRAESAYDPEAVSVRGARGLMQLMPATAERFGVRADWLFDPEKNLEAGTRYLAWLTERYPGDLKRVLAAYNAGEGAVERYAAPPHEGVPPYRETREYIRRIAGYLESAPPAGAR